jgi:hypothetical protein
MCLRKGVKKRGKNGEQKKKKKKRTTGSLVRALIPCRRVRIICI